jgi:XTP/dITP diphosphohydrolase
LRLLIATGNRGKVREFREMLGDSRFAWSDLSEHPDIPAADETGATFRANACLKAAYYATRLNTWALADDSGLEVDALGGAPGVVSARWAEIHNAGHGDADNNMLLLKQMNDVPDERRTARFVCVLALADPQGRIILTAADAVEGRLLRAPRGSNGFGYDPLFLIDELGKTTAELPPDQKHQISHRGKALRVMNALMHRSGIEATDNTKAS